MKKRLKFKSLILIPFFCLSSCNKGGNTISYGKGPFSPWDENTSRVSIAVETKTKQELSASFEVSVGADIGFEQLWKDDYWGCKPDYGYFAIETSVVNIKEEVLFSEYYPLVDFPNDEKYGITINRNYKDGYYSYEYSRTKEFIFDFNTLNEEKGKIAFIIFYYDDINDCPAKDDVYLYGIDWGRYIKFSIKDNFVYFSK